MRRTALAIASAGVLAAAAIPASATWVYEAQGGAFDDDPLHIALTAEGGRGFGVRCDSVELSLIYISNDRSIDEGTMRLANEALPQLLIRVDGGDIVRHFATLDVAANGAAMVVAPIIGDSLPTLIGASEAITVGVEVLGEVFLEAGFTTGQVRAALGQVVSECDNPLMDMN